MPSDVDNVLRFHGRGSDADYARSLPFSTSLGVPGQGDENNQDISSLASQIDIRKLDQSMHAHFDVYTEHLMLKCRTRTSTRRSRSSTSATSCATDSTNSDAINNPMSVQHQHRRPVLRLGRVLLLDSVPSRRRKEPAGSFIPVPDDLLRLNSRPAQLEVRRTPSRRQTSLGLEHSDHLLA